MSAFDWRSERAYANLEKADTAGIAWEWLRRDSEYQGEYKALLSVDQLDTITYDFRQKWGLSFRG